jgi:N6-adenosine-specific RNA methylase IME4
VDDQGIEGLPELAEYLGGLREYADELWQHTSRQRAPRSYGRQSSNLKLFGRKPRPSPFASLPNKHYRVVYSDPPWPVPGVPYKTMSTTQMANVFPVHELNDRKEGTVHFMWVVSSLLPEAVQLLKDWGYTYRTIAFAWVKTKGKNKAGTPKLYMGLGATSRGGMEICLEAYSGRRPPSVDTKDVMQVVVAPLGEHSAKPAEVRNRIVELYPDAPRLELFARNQWDGWDVFGDHEGDPVPQPTGAQPRGLINVALPTPGMSWLKQSLTTAQAAKKLGVTPHRVIDFINGGKLVAVKQGRQWAVSRRSVVNLAKKPRQSGRPKKP